jgi:tRNA/tmRNA/rRNA uracil-C5-methylase (TrmA/RlmC/RlmD family)
MSHRGDGVATIEGFITFVPHTKIGEIVEIEIIKVKPSAAIGKVIKWIKTADVKAVDYSKEPEPENLFVQREKDILTEEW